MPSESCRYDELLATIADFRDGLVTLLEQRFGSIDRRFEAVDRRFEAIDRRFDKVDRRFDAVEGWLQRNDERLARLEAARPQV